MDFEDFIRGTVSRLNMEMPPFETDGSVRLFLEDIEIRFTHLESYQAIMLETPVCPLPAGGGEAFMAELLHFNHREGMVSGGAFTLDEDGTVFIRHLFALPLINVEMFCAVLPEHVKRIQSWRELSMKYELEVARMTGCAEGPMETDEMEDEPLTFFLP